MSVSQFISFNDIRKRRCIKDTDVLRLRKAYYEDGTIGYEEAEELFSINNACPVQSPSWPDFFVEAITDYAVHQERPEGYLTVANAQWLIDQISKDGRVETTTELELLINVIDASRWSPTSLVAFALNQVKQAVIDNDGPTRVGLSLQAREIGEGDVDLLQRILYAFGGDECSAISRAEAEVLFDLNDATLDADNAPAWSDLFVKAIANSIMAASGYKVPSRQEALRRLHWIEAPADLSLSGILGRIGDGFGGVLGLYDVQSPEERSIARLERQKIEIITNERITEGEAHWLSDRIGRDGVLHDNEKALLAFIKKESPQIHPALENLISRSEKAA